MKIIGLKVDGFRKLSAIEMTFADKGFTFIKGDNEQGKTSILDVIEWLFVGKKKLNQDIIQHGKEKAVGEIDLDEYTIKRITTKNSDRIEIKNKEGFQMTSKPQEFLDKLVNDLTFNPFPFINKTGIQKLEFMQNFLNIDTSGIDSKIIDYEAERTLCGREGKNLGEVQECEKVEPVSTAELFDKLDVVIEFNEKQKNIEKRIERLLESRSVHTKAIENYETEIREIKAKIKQEDEQIQNIDDKRRSEPKPKPLKSTASIDKEIQSVDEVNEKARKYVNYLSKKKEVEAKRSEYTNLSEKIRLKRNEKKEIYQKTNIGVEGLEIREDGVYFNNIYSENWSDSQKIKISLELCQLLKPELNAVFIDRGESLGIKVKKEIREWLADNNIQCVITVIADDIPKNIPSNVYYIEEGKIIK